MKSKKMLLSLAIAALFAHSGTAASPNQTQSATPATKVAHIGDGVRSIGDTNRMVEAPQDLRPQVFAEKRVKARPATHSEAMDLSSIAPTTYSETSYYSPTSSGCNAAPQRGWASFETLLWFAADRQSPALATTSAINVLPVSGNAGVTDAFGGQIDSGVIPGYRGTIGRYFGDCQKVGLSGRAYGTFSASDSFASASDGSTSLGVPFFNTLIGAPDAYLIGYNSGVPAWEGSLNARSEFDMVGADGSLHLLLSRSQDHRVDLLAGYSFNKLSNSIGLSTTSINRLTGDTILDGTVFTTDDSFSTDNQFHGAHLGVLSSVVRKRVSFSTLAKIAFGNISQSSTVNGSTTINDGLNFNNYAGGLFAQQSNIGTLNQDVFGFIPELGLKLGIAVRENLDFTVGYTFMMWSSVLLAGDQMDSNIDLSQVNGPLGASPAPRLDESSYWMQSIDLGLQYNF